MKEDETWRKASPPILQGLSHQRWSGPSPSPSANCLLCSFSIFSRLSSRESTFCLIWVSSFLMVCRSSPFTEIKSGRTSVDGLLRGELLRICNELYWKFTRAVYSHRPAKAATDRTAMHGKRVHRAKDSTQLYRKHTKGHKMSYLVFL